MSFIGILFKNEVIFEGESFFILQFKIRALFKKRSKFWTTSLTFNTFSLKWELYSKNDQNFEQPHLFFNTFLLI